jgi:hypothetical protein
MARYCVRPPRVLSSVVHAWGWDAAWLALCGCVWELVGGIAVLLGSIVLLASREDAAAEAIGYACWGVGALGLVAGFLRFAHAWRVRVRGAVPPI